MESDWTKPTPTPGPLDLKPEIQLDSELAEVLDSRVGRIKEILAPDFDAARLRKWVWALSGGGAKGAFEVGAIMYLSTRLSLYPEAVCGTSVGAINALAAAEATEAAMMRIKDAWCRLTSSADMWRLADWVGEVANLETFRSLNVEMKLLEALDLVPGRDPEHGTGSGFQLISTESKVLATVADILLPPGAFAGLIADEIEDVERDLTRAAEIFSEKGKSLLDLTPTRRLADRNLRADAIKDSGKRLRLISVGLEDGHIYIVTEKGELIRNADTTSAAGMTTPYGRRNVYELEATDLHDALLRGAMASAAIPMTFPPEVLSATSGHTVTCVDGGVREVLPLKEATYIAEKELADTPGRAGIIGIFAGNVGNIDGAYFIEPGWLPRRDYRDATLLDIAKRGADIAVDEVALDELRRMKGGAGDVDLIPIFPLFPVTETSLIDPGLIQIQIAYGYMTAYDSIRYHFGEIDEGTYSQLFITTNFIAQARRTAWEIEQEQELTGSPAPGPGWSWIWEEGAVGRLRSIKRQIAQALWVRVVAAQTYECVPTLLQMSNLAVGNRNGLYDWYKEYEYHSFNSPYYMPTVAHSSGTGSVFNRGWENTPWTEKIERRSDGSLVTIPAEHPPLLSEA
jgi:predicted acylesterase/phospholipase RssA